MKTNQVRPQIRIASWKKTKFIDQQLGKNPVKLVTSSVKPKAIKKKDERLNFQNPMNRNKRKFNYEKKTCSFPDQKKQTKELGSTIEGRRKNLNIRRKKKSNDINSAMSLRNTRSNQFRLIAKSFKTTSNGKTNLIAIETRQAQ